jgi:hypothetical protein
MKVKVVGGNQEVINKLNELGLEDLEVVQEGADLTLDELAQKALLQSDGVVAANKILAEVFISQNAHKFFKLDDLKSNPMKMDQHKINQIKKRRAKNKMARKSRQINAQKRKSWKKKRKTVA